MVTVSTLHARGQVEDALLLARQLIGELTATRLDAGRLLVLAALYARFGSVADALASLDALLEEEARPRVLGMPPLSMSRTTAAGMWLDVGSAARRVGAPHAAISCLRAAQAASTEMVDPEWHATVLLELGLALEAVGAVGAAAEAYADAVRRAPRFARASVQLAWCEYNREGGRGLEAAARGVEAALAADPRVYEAWYLHGRILEGRGATNDAAAAYDMAARLRPSDPAPWTRIGLLALNCGQAAAAVPPLVAAAQRAPMHPEVWLNLGMAYMGVGQLHEAAVARDRGMSLLHQSTAAGTPHQPPLLFTGSLQPHPRMPPPLPPALLSAPAIEYHPAAAATIPLPTPVAADGRDDGGDGGDGGDDNVDDGAALSAGEDGDNDDDAGADGGDEEEDEEDGDDTRAAITALASIARSAPLLLATSSHAVSTTTTTLAGATATSAAPPAAAATTVVVGQPRHHAAVPAVVSRGRAAAYATVPPTPPAPLPPLLPAVTGVPSSTAAAYTVSVPLSPRAPRAAAGVPSAAGSETTSSGGAGGSDKAKRKSSAARQPLAVSLPVPLAGAKRGRDGTVPTVQRMTRTSVLIDCAAPVLAPAPAPLAAAGGYSAMAATTAAAAAAAAGDRGGAPVFRIISAASSSAPCPAPVSRVESDGYETAVAGVVVARVDSNASQASQFVSSAPHAGDV